MAVVTATVQAVGKAFYRFPQDSDRRSRWVAAVRRVEPDGKPWWPSKYDRVCSNHFHERSPSLDPYHPDYVPSVSMGYSRAAASAARVAGQVGPERTLDRTRRRQTFVGRRAETLAKEKALRESEELALSARREAAEHDHGFYVAREEPSSNRDHDSVSPMEVCGHNVPQ